MKQFMKFIASVLMITFPGYALAYDFEINGIGYNIVSAVTFTCEVGVQDNLSQKDLIIPDKVNYRDKEFKVVQIGNSAFQNTELNSLSLPSSIEIIGSSAFENCKLSEITFPESIKEIKERAFFNSGLKNIVLDFERQDLGKVLIGRNAFSECDLLEKVILGNNIELFTHNSSSDGDMYYGVFTKCNNLKHIDIRGDIEVIPAYTFLDCPNILNIDITGSIGKLGNDAWNFPIHTLNIEGTVENLGIERYAWERKNLLPCQYLSISGNVTNCYGGFSESLLEASLIGKISYLGGFTDCILLESLILPNSVKSIQGFSGCKSLNKLVLSDSIQILSDNMFNKCLSLKELTLPSSITTIKTGWLWGPGTIESDLIDWEITSLIIRKNPDHNLISISYRGTGDGCRLNWLCPKLEKLVLERDMFDGNSEFSRERYNVIENFKYLQEIELFNITLPLNLGDLPALKKITFRDKIPPKINKSSFTNEQIMEVEIYVPFGFKETYENSTWGRFWNIKELPKIEATVITLNETRITINVNDDFKLQSRIEPEETTDRTIVWTSSDDKIATVSSNGIVTGVSLGKATITATCGEVSATCEVEVLPVLAESIMLNESEISISEKETFQLLAAISPDNVTDKNIEWVSLDEHIATVSDEGIVNGVSVGITEIIASCGEVSATCEVEVLPVLAESIMLNECEISISEKETFQLIATIYPENVTEKSIEWVSFDEHIASVSNEGIVTGVSVGETDIFAFCGEVYATCKVKVLGEDGVDNILMNIDSQLSIYSVEGILLKKECSLEELNELPKGIYIIISGNQRFKISI